MITGKKYLKVIVYKMPQIMGKNKQKQIMARITASQILLLINYLMINFL